MLPPVNDAPILTTPPSPPVEMEVQARLGRMTAPLTDVFRLPAPQSPWLGRLKRDQQVAIVSQWNGWFAIVMGDGSQAYVPQKSVEVLPYQVKTVVPTVPLAPPPAPKAAAPAPMPAAPRAGDRSAAPFELPSNEVTRVVIDEALRYRGLPYVWGGNGEEGFDCSGLVKHCFATRGIQLPRRAREQAQIGDPAPLDQLEAGDRLYFSVHRANDHTAIYLGNGYFVHASSSQGKVTVDHLSTPLYGKHLTSARRSP
jgi:cell wall-associated NlpC family hydrolase